MTTERPDAAAWPGPAAISALGACTCFGGMTTAAGAARGGLSRAHELPETAYVDEETSESEPVVGAPIDGITDGFEGVGRLGRMAGIALDELIEAAAWVNPRRLACWIAAPPLAEEDARRLGAAAARSLGVAPDRVHVRAAGLAGVAQALREAAAALRGGRCDHALVGACDSWLDAARLQQITDEGRLKTRNHPVGFTPGEAAVSLLLERPGAAGGGRGAPPPRITQLCEELEERPRRGAADEGAVHPTGRGLARAAAGALGRGHGGTLYVDLNGEPYRAADWGMALTHLQPGHDLGAWAREHPAASFGDTGVAAPLLAVGLAARAFARGYAEGDRAVIVSSSDGPERLALLVERARDGERG